MKVEEILEENNIRYKPAGKDVLIHCLNPKHEDHNPSLRIDRLTGLYNCFGCGFKGNIFTFFGEAVDKVNIKVLQLKNKISGIVKNELLMPLGTEPFYRPHRGISKETYKTFDAFTHNNYEDRIVFPIRDITGKLQALVGRYAFSDAPPKYLIDPPQAKLPLFPAKPIIYKDSIILVEGIFDVLNLYDKGLENVICGFGKTLGDSDQDKKRSLTLELFIPLKIQGVNKIYILYDAGAIKSSDRLARLLEKLFIVDSIEYPLFIKDKNKDPGNLTKEEVTKLREYIYDKDRNSRQI